MDEQTGEPLSGIDHLRQSIRRILTTPIGSCVENRDFGSNLFELIDSPINPETTLDIYAATIEALSTWETRISVEKVSVKSAAPTGKIEITLSATLVENGEPILIDGIIL